MKKQALGRGLDALLNTDTEPTTVGSSQFNEIPLAQIKANPNQPRTEFDDDTLEELATSIKINGIISPITLRKVSDNEYQIIAGERRVRASRLIGLEKIPAYIKTANDEEMMEMALIENIQREDLNAIEIALSYNNLARTYNLTQEELSERVGKKRATITNYLRLLKLPAEVQMGLKDKKIDMGHARALAGIEDPTQQIKIYEQILAEGSSVRRAEELVRNGGKKPNGKKSTGSPNIMPEEYNELQEGLNQLLNSKIQLLYNNEGKGKIVIPFKSDDDLMRLMSMFDRLKNND